MPGHFGWLAASVPLVAVALGASVPVGAQPPAKAATSRPWTVPRTPDGRPDLQGIWTNATLTPLERPRAMGNRAFFTEKEAAALEAQLMETKIQESRDQWLAQARRRASVSIRLEPVAP